MAPDEGNRKGSGDRVEATTDTVALKDTSAPSRVRIGSDSLGELERASTRYRASKLLGEGGMGEVRLCTDERIGRSVAMKVMRAEPGADADDIARFVREARVQGQLEHPAIVPIHDLGLTPSGQPFFTMKRVKGLTLRQILEGIEDGVEEIRSRFTRRKLLSAFVTVCEAIELAHTRGVLHRDIKPDNIMLGEFGEVHVLDWGLAKIADVEEFERTGAPGSGSGPVGGDATVSGSVLGTPGYMSPEQIAGLVDELDGRSDVYALGTVLFEILAGEPLHDTDRTLTALAAAMADAEARPSARAPGRDIAPELDAICERATAYRREDRYASVRAMIDDLERYLDGDRDLARRRELAAEYADAARRDAERAAAADGAEAHALRSDALRGLGRALALDPDHEGAARSLVELILAPPKHTPPEVERSIEESRNQLSRTVAMIGTFAMVPLFVGIPALVWLGVRTPAMFVLTLAVAAAISLNSYLGLRRHSMSAYRRCFAMGTLLAAAFAALTGRVAGSLIIVPAFAVAASLMLSLVPYTIPWLVLLAGVCAVAVPYTLEFLGVLDPSYVFRDGVWTIAPNVLELSGPIAPTVLLMFAIALVAASAICGGAFRRALERAEHRQHLLTWQLRQLVPPAKR